MKKIASVSHAALAAVLTMALSSAALPQNREDAKERIAQQVEETKRRLNLTEDQAEKAKPIMRDSFQKRVEIMKKHGLGSEETIDSLSFREKRKLGRELKSERDAAEKKLAKILTKDQMREYKKIQDERRAEMREKMESRKR